MHTGTAGHLTKIVKLNFATRLTNLKQLNRLLNFRATGYFDSECRESNTGMFGGNSNWRGPIWMPVNGLIIRGLLQMYPFYGPDFEVECPTGSGKYMTLRRLAKIFLRDTNGRRPVYGGTKKFQEDPHWKDYEYFHGDNGAGLGASHQTGWTGIIARSLDLFARITPEATLQGASKYTAQMTREQVTGKVA